MNIKEDDMVSAVALVVESAAGSAAPTNGSSPDEAELIEASAEGNGDGAEPSQ
jgi:hypothetical protein